MVEEIISSGYCPELQRQYNITVRYDGNVRLLCECEHAGFHGCSQHPCPLLSKYPANR